MKTATKISAVASHLTEDTQGTPCFVVGIGASAGGQEALEQLFTTMPTDCGIAFIVIMHLPPAGPSFLADMLGRYTTMPVVTAEDGMPLVANRVHVIPAGRSLAVNGGLLRLEEPSAPYGAIHPIDRLFHSLADEFGRHAIAVILSGSGTDGALGAKLVKDGGGVVIVQEPATAAYPSMPRNAISSGTADVILLAEEIPAKITEIAHGICDLGSQECRFTTLDEDLDTIFGIVKNKTGHDFSAYKRNTVMRRIERRMAVNTTAGLGRYIALLREDGQEAHALCQDILIGVTSFFRDPEAFAVLRRDIIPRLFANRSQDDTVRIWHACCASGEEVYTMAMLIREYLNEQGTYTNVLIFATDIDEVAIAQARSGIYSDDIEENVGIDRLKTFFVRHDGRWQVKSNLREMVVFAHHSLIKDPPFSRLDLMVCRNFLIYLNPDMQKRLIAMFNQVLNPGGFLFLGGAETVGRNSELFSVIDKKWKIFEQRNVERRPEMTFPFNTAVRKLPEIGRTSRSSETAGSSAGAAVEKILVERYSPPCVVVNEKYEVVHVTTRMKRFLEVPLGEPTKDILRMAREELCPALRAAIYKVFSDQQKVEFKGVRVDDSGEELWVNVVVEPLDESQLDGRLAMVMFEQVVAPPPSRAVTGESAVPERDDSSRETLIRHLEEQLRITHEQFQATSEQLETSHEGFLSANEELMSINEEFQSVNEELQSTNEELETSKEELQALNEELLTVNSELQGKVEELNQINSDMENLLTSSEIATLFLDRQMNIMGFTPAVAAIFNLLPSDVGRAFRHFAGKIDWPTLAQNAETVLSGQPFAEREVASLGRERCYLKRILPYRGQEGRIDGIVITFIDITERKLSEQALIESEERVRQKLESILSPEGDIGNLELGDIIDSQSIQELMHDFNKLVPIPMAIIDLNGKVLVGVGWQDICTRFHRVHHETSDNCRESDIQLTSGITPGEFKLYKCKNNMWDVATPITVGGRHVGNFFSGQFFFDDEPLDFELFKSQARRYGFNEDEYIAALACVPRLSRDTVATCMEYFIKFADIISKLSYSNIKLARSLSEGEILLGALHESEEQFRTMFERHRAVMLLIDPDNGAIVDANDAAAEFYGSSREALSTLAIQNINQMPYEEMALLMREVVRERRSNFKAPHRLSNGEIRWVEVYSSPVVTRGKTLLFSIIHDVTDREQAEAALRESAARINLLAATASELLSSNSPQEVVDSLCQKVMTFLDCDVFFNFLADDNERRLHLNACAGIAEADRQRLEWLEYGTAVCGCVARDACRIVIEDVAANPDPRTELVKSYGIQAYACHPLIVQERVLGTLSFGTRTRTSFSSDDLALMKAVADQVAIAMERMQQGQALKKSHDELELRVAERTGALDESIEILQNEINQRKVMEASLLRLNRLYTVLGEIDKAIIRASDRDSLFNDFCRIAVDQGGFLLSWVGLLDDSGQVRNVASCGATGYLEGLHVTVMNEPAGIGPTGQSIRNGSFHISNDFLHDPDTRPWHDRARKYGIRATASVAIKEEGRVIGAFTLYAAEKGFFDRQMEELLVQMGADVSFALDNLMRENRRHATEMALREETLERLRIVEALREKEQMLLQQNRLAAMGEMINNIAHQWRQPLNVLGLLVQQMRLYHSIGKFSGEYLDESVNKSMELINYMSQTIDDFRNFFKPDKEQVQFTVNELVARTISLVEDGFKAHKIKLDFNVDANPAVIGFPNEYYQVLLNILMNARDAILERRPENARIAITVGMEGERAVVTIADNAGGIAAESIDRIFEPYFTTKGPDKGTGVGLFMSKTIIEKNMNGRLTVRNTGEGAEFRIVV
ncbi:MAG: hypothetical protein A2076_07645 [Geobacteraceae bacterium GWC2_53_11]|nr:MAG: hypothetical protein A2076_07645 [Geobacteraceae bacterium GWC2_53_11]